MYRAWAYFFVCVSPSLIWLMYFVCGGMFVFCFVLFCVLFCFVLFFVLFVCLGFFFFVSFYCSVCLC